MLVEEADAQKVGSRWVTGWMGDTPEIVMTTTAPAALINANFCFRVDSFGENILTLLLNDGAHDESGLEKRKKCLLWLKDNKDEALGKIISTRNCSGSNAMSLVGNFDWGSDEEKDQMISWLLGKGANISHMNPTEAEAYLDR